jgi:hypothetical protein
LNSYSNCFRIDSAILSGLGIISFFRFLACSSSIVASRPVQVTDFKIIWLSMGDNIQRSTTSALIPSEQLSLGRRSGCYSRFRGKMPLPHFIVLNPFWLLNAYPYLCDHIVLTSQLPGHPESAHHSLPEKGLPVRIVPDKMDIPHRPFVTIAIYSRKINYFKILSKNFLTISDFTLFHSISF